MKKLLSIVLTLVLLLSVIPMALGVSVAETAGTGDYAIYFDSSISNNFWVTQKDASHLEIGMEELNLPAGNIYTVEYDVYALTAGSNVVFGATTATWSTGSAIKDGHQVWKSAPANVNEWTRYSFNVTTTADWKGVIFYVIDDADGFTGYIDNLTIKDSQGTVVSSFEPTADDISNKSNCASIVELSADVAYAKNPDYAVYIDNSANDIQSNQIWFNVLGMSQLQLPAGKTYTLKFDNYALSASTGGHGYKPIDSTAGEVIVSGGTWWNTNDVINGWATQSREFTVLEDKNALAYHTLYVGAGFKGYLDNFRVYDGETEVARLEFDASNLGKENSGATVVLLPVDVANAKPCKHVYDNACDATCNLCEEVREGVGHKYTNIYDVTCNTCGSEREASDENKALFIDTTADANGTPTLFWFNDLGMAGNSIQLAPGSYKVVFDVYPLELPEGGNLFHYRNSHGSNGSTQAGWWKGDLVTEEWQTTENAFTVTDAAKSGNHVFYVYGGFKGYVDNFKVVDSNGNTVEVSFTGFADLTIPEKHEGKLRIADKSEIIIPDYAVLVDNSAGTDFNKFYLHEVGMDHSKTYPIGDYTIKFDFYALEIASNKNIVACFSATGWSGDAFPGNQGQKWLEIQEKVGEWQTLSFDITTIAEGQFPNFSIGAGLKGYFDNYQIIDKATGETLLDFSPVKADLGKVSKEINTVVKLPDCVAVEGVAHTYTDYVSNNDATCTANATETGTCVCGATDTREIADSKLAHTYDDMYDTDCNVCSGTRVLGLDVNSDGEIDICDLVALENAIEEGATLRVDCDLNGDGVFDKKDVSILRKHLLRA